MEVTDRYERIRKALAKGPTPGPWFHGAANGAHMYCVYDKRCWTDEDGARHGETPNMVVVVSPDDGKYANAAHIAACDPDTIRALLEERDALVEALAAQQPAGVVPTEEGLALAQKWEDEAAESWGEDDAHRAKQECCDELRDLLTAALAAHRKQGDEQ